MVPKKPCRYQIRSQSCHRIAHKRANAILAQALCLRSTTARLCVSVCLWMDKKIEEAPADKPSVVISLGEKPFSDKGKEDEATDEKHHDKDSSDEEVNAHFNH